MILHLTDCGSSSRLNLALQASTLGAENQATREHVTSLTVKGHTIDRMLVQPVGAYALRHTFYFQRIIRFENLCGAERYGLWPF